MLDEQDLALVHALQEAPRASWARLSSSLAIDARTLARRYARLHDTGLVRVMATTGPRLLERLLFAHLRVQARPGEAAGVAERIARWPQTGTVRLTDGSSDVHALLVGAQHPGLMRTAHERVATLESVQHSEINTVLRAGDLGRAARLDALSARQTADLRHGHSPRPPATKSATLGLDDFELIRLLLHDGRAEATDLAAALDRDPSAVSRRLSRLHNAGFVDLVALTPDSVSSAPVRALLWCTVDPQDAPELLRRAAALPWIGLLTLITGHANVVAVANLTTRAHLPAAQAELTSLCPSLRFRETQLSPRAEKLHLRRLTADDRLTDDVADPFRELRHELVDT